MDILISSNLERLIYQIGGCSAENDSQLMESLAKTGKYTITEEMREQLDAFYGNYATEEDTASAIHRLYEKTGYVIDTHTAVAEAIYEKYVAETGDKTKTLIASTASPFKFTRSVMTAIDDKYAAWEDFQLVDELSRIGYVKLPEAISEVRTAGILHNAVYDVNEMESTVKAFLNI
jgi:threonine synthase